jgi:stringent starvation protein B
VSALSTKPYLIRAIYEWCVDSGLTPYLAVAVDEQTRVPPEYVKEGEIVLNIGPAATPNLVIDNSAIRFSARFGGISRDIFVPVSAVIGIYARESGQGLFFGREDETLQEGGEATGPSAGAPAPDDRPPVGPGRGKPSLKVVK